jgi:hypothetical protein
VGAHTQKEELTLLISTLLDWYEGSEPTKLEYKGISYRGAYEKYFYFDTLSNPCNLKPLLIETKGWRVEQQNSAITQIYDKYLFATQKQALASKLISNIMPALRIVMDYIRHFKGLMQTYKSVSDNDTSQGERRVGFFVIEKRFINFFSKIEQHLDCEEKTYFSQLSYPVEVLPRTARFSSSRRFKLRLSEFKLPYNHSFFMIYYRFCFFYERINVLLEYFSPEVLLFAEGTSHYEEIAALVAARQGITTIRVQSGRAAVLHSGYYNMPYDVMLNWGEGFSARYKSVSPSNKHIVCGNPDLDERHAKQRVAGRKTLVVFTQPKNKGWIGVEDYNILINLVQHLLIYSDIHILVRMHPVDNDDAFIKIAKASKQVEIVNSPKFSLAAVLKRADCVISFASTTISESAAWGVIPVIYKLPKQPKLYPYPEDEGAALVVESIQDAVIRVQDIIDNPSSYNETRNKMKNFSEYYFDTKSGNAMDKVVSEIRSAADNKQ